MGVVFFVIITLHQLLLSVKLKIIRTVIVIILVVTAAGVFV